MLQFRIQIHQRALTIVPAAAFINANIHVIRAEFGGQVVDGLVPVAPQDRLIVPMGTRDEDALFARWFGVGDEVGGGNAVENEVNLDEAPCDEDDEEESKDAAPDKHSAESASVGE